MEFRYRAGETRSAQTSTPAPASLPPLLQGGIPLATNGSDFLLWREIEKEKIRQEIIARENWRWELEKEVRAELALERVVGISNSRHMSLAAPHGFSLVRPHLNPIEVVAPPQHEASSQHIQDQVFVLDKNDPQVCGDKRKAEATDVSAPSGPNKILKQGFSCTLCQVSATSEKGLQDHLQGKKHRKKEAVQKRQLIGLEVEKPSRQPSEIGEEAVKRCITVANMNPMMFDNGVLESRTEAQCVQESHNRVALEETIASTHNQFNEETEGRRIPMLKPGLIFPNIEPPAESKQL